VKLTDIESRIATDRDDFAQGFADQSIRDREYLLGLVRDQEAQLARVIELAHWAGKRGWTISAAEIRKALEEAEDVALFDAGVAEDGANVEFLGAKEAS
jgi:hypothetical protein